MTFNAKAFERAQFEPRMEAVQVPALADFFEEGDAAEFTVRNLTANESQLVNEAAANRNKAGLIVEALAGEGTHAEKVGAIRAELGLSGDLTQEVARRMEMMVIATVEPVMTHATVAKFAEIAPIEFFQLTTKILELSGRGAMLKKK